MFFRQNDSAYLSFSLKNLRQLQKVTASFRTGTCEMISASLALPPNFYISKLTGQE